MSKKIGRVLALVALLVANGLVFSANRAAAGEIEPTGVCGLCYCYPHEACVCCQAEMCGNVGEPGDCCTSIYDCN